jgi:DNA-directed RNA polymerase subunit K/omega
MTDTARPTTRPANSFEFVTIAAARARQLLEGCVPRVDGSAKPARRALQEVVAGEVRRAEETTSDPEAPAAG